MFSYCSSLSSFATTSTLAKHIFSVFLIEIIDRLLALNTCLNLMSFLLFCHNLNRHMWKPHHQTECSSSLCKSGSWGIWRVVGKTTLETKHKTVFLRTTEFIIEYEWNIKISMQNRSPNNSTQHYIHNISQSSPQPLTLIRLKYPSHLWTQCSPQQWLQACYTYDVRVNCTRLHNTIHMMFMWNHRAPYWNDYVACSWTPIVTSLVASLSSVYKGRE